MAMAPSLLFGLVGSMMLLMLPNGAQAGSCFCDVRVSNSNATCGGFAFSWHMSGEKDGGCDVVSTTKQQSWRFSGSDCKKGHFHWDSTTCSTTGQSIAVADGECKEFTTGKSVFVTNCGENNLAEAVETTSTILLVIIIVSIVLCSSSIAACFYCCLKKNKTVVVQAAPGQPGMQPQQGQVMVQPPYNGQQQTQGYPVAGQPAYPQTQGVGPK